MSSRITFKTPNVKLFNFKGAVSMFNKESRKAVDRSLAILQFNIVQLTPVGATGDLRSSINTKVDERKGEILGVVFAGKTYALPVELGRKASPVSKTGQLSLTRWILKSSGGRSWFQALKGKYPRITVKQATFLLARSLKRKARKGQKFFEKGVNNAMPKVNQIMRQLSDDIARGLTT